MSVVSSSGWMLSRAGGREKSTMSQPAIKLPATGEVGVPPLLLSLKRRPDLGGACGGVFELTPEACRYWLEFCNPHNRTLNLDWVRQIADAIRAGEWKINGETVVFNPDTTMGNGQHRCKAIILTNMPLWSWVIWGEGTEEGAF